MTELMRVEQQTLQTGEPFLFHWEQVSKNSFPILEPEFGEKFLSGEEKKEIGERERERGREWNRRRRRRRRTEDGDK